MNKLESFEKKANIWFSLFISTTEEISDNDDKFRLVPDIPSQLNYMLLICYFIRMELYMDEEFEISRSICPSYWLVVGSATH